ncbi:MAG: nuclear transport factor 2 family protein [Proteobacteria bacterium]|nr:MAG: nuclear transport factor 2 family protein [Pseudomonadota bacterium]
MSLTHTDIILDIEARLMHSIIACDVKMLKKIMHPEFVFTDESGQTYHGVDTIPHLNPDVLQLEEIDILSRNMTFYTNIAVVNSIEIRKGFYRGMRFERKFRVMRTWKFSGRQWQLIAGSLVVMPERSKPTE